MKLQWIFVILLSRPFTKYFSGTCLSVEILKGDIVRKSLRALVPWGSY